MNKDKKTRAKVGRPKKPPTKMMRVPKHLEPEIKKLIQTRENEKSDSIILSRFGNRTVEFEGLLISESRQFPDSEDDEYPGMVNEGYKLSLYETKNGEYVVEIIYEKPAEDDPEVPHHAYFDAERFESVEEATKFLSGFDPLKNIKYRNPDKKTFRLEFKRAVSLLLRNVESEKW